MKNKKGIKWETWTCPFAFFFAFSICFLFAFFCFTFLHFASCFFQFWSSAFWFSICFLFFLLFFSNLKIIWISYRGEHKMSISIDISRSRRPMWHEFLRLFARQVCVLMCTVKICQLHWMPFILRFTNSKHDLADAAEQESGMHAGQWTEAVPAGYMRFSTMCHVD